MSKLIIAAVIALAPILLLLLKRLPSKDEKKKEDIAKYEKELEEIRALMAKALTDGFDCEWNLLNVRRERLLQKLRRLHRGLKTDSSA